MNRSNETQLKTAVGCCSAVREWMEGGSSTVGGWLEWVATRSGWLSSAPRSVCVGDGFDDASIMSAPVSAAEQTACIPSPSPLL
mmetsp:Transcript_106666/g.159558  ORF Transcript_106666/g.159558 Transcript_106666/m.159558 type:complete len:84 (+) Transcript_106666:1-252(+)